MQLIALLVFVITISLIFLDKYPQAVITMCGGSCLLFFKVLSQEQALHFIDFNTLGLLIGMMLMVAVLKRTGVFEYVAIKAIKTTHNNPKQLLVALALITGILSGLLDNVTTVLITVPISFALADALKISPMPFLISEIFFSNIGGTATLIGDPPNILIGVGAQLSFMDFILNNLPIIILVSVFVLSVLIFLFRNELILKQEINENTLHAFDEQRAITDKQYFTRALLVFGLILLGFITHSWHHLDLASLALGGAFMLLLVTKTTSTDLEELLKEIDWPTIFFFIGLFIIVGGLDATGLIKKSADYLFTLSHGSITILTFGVLWLSALATTVVNSVPYTATMISIIKTLSQSINQDITPLWWALSLGAGLGGNATLVGAAANIVVAGLSRRSNYPLNAWVFFKTAFPIMLGTILICTIYIRVRYFL